MKTYIVFAGEDEVFRGVLPDCCYYISETYTYTNQNVKLHILIMCPVSIDYQLLDKIDKNLMMTKLQYSKRESFLKNLQLKNVLKETKNE